MQGIKKAFKCSRCGYCCRSLFGFSRGWLKGLGLTKEETILFNPKQIFPQSAIGINGPEYIFVYQLGLAVCPHISQDNQCAIYDKRPMICRCYPFEMVGFGINGKKNIMITQECSQIKGTKGISEEDIPIECEQMHLHFQTEFMRHRKTGIKFWDFDLASKRWQLRK